jgi:hypothetical protein
VELPQDRRGAAGVHPEVSRQPRPEFAAEVADRAARADQYFTIDKTPGSRSMRGKVIILLGPPSALEIINDNSTRTQLSTPASAVGSAGATAGAADNGDGPSRGGAMTSVQSVRNYHFTYAHPKLDVVVPADPYTGQDLPLTKQDQAALDAAFEDAARNSINKQ